MVVHTLRDLYALTKDSALSFFFAASGFKLVQLFPSIEYSYSPDLK